ncbi:hypothetical protein MST22_12200 [Virgibacillus halodenitrificans]|uniref:hypothetical protein n=1 Tax=Virgibacillus halodenitrificans TaxID=1482 RepID=UPI001FB48BF3|nr:hypothetical protein [Virgibacillus halodenitrificans]MCJ0931914.1 hypothetical protein [Virgibacillus halodenitrificans]
MNISIGQREFLLEILNYEYVIPNEFHVCIKDAIRKYATNTRYSEATIDSMLKKPQSMATSIGAIQDNNLSLFRGKFAEWLACIEYNALKNKGIVLMTIINPDSTSKADLLHIIKKGDKYEAIPGPDIKCGGNRYVLYQWNKIVNSRYDIPMVDMDGILTTEEGLKMLTDKQREKFEQLKQLHPRKKPIKSEWNKQDINRLMLDYLKYVSEGITPADSEDRPFIASKENRDRIRDKLSKLSCKNEKRSSWDVFRKKASELPNIPENYLNTITRAKVEKKKGEGVSKKGSQAPTENIKYAKGKENNNTTRSVPGNKYVNKPKQKGLIKRVANLLGYDSPTEMFVDAGVKNLPAAVAAGRVIANKIFRGGTNSGASLLDNHVNEKKYKNSIKIENSTNETANTNSSTHASLSEHIVKGHGQHYNTREGRIFKRKEPFLRGKNNESI